MRVAILISGSGSNLAAIVHAVKGGKLPITIALVISNVAEAKGLEIAEREGLSHRVISHRAFPSREAFDAELVRTMREAEVELVVLAGFMRIITPVLLEAYPHRVLNVHPALLPAFPGTHGARQALEYGARVAGCTVHLVDAGTDTGPIVAQQAVPIQPGDTELALQTRIQRAEHHLLPMVIGWFAEGLVTVEAPTKQGGRPLVRCPLWNPLSVIP